MMISTFLRQLLCLMACLGLSIPSLASPATGHQMNRIGKPDAGLGFASGSEYHLDVGRVQNLVLTLSSEAHRGTLRLSLSSSDPQLELLSPTHYKFDLAQESAPILSLDLLPHGEGRFYLMFSAELVRQGQPMRGQSFGAAIQVGEPVQTQRLKASSAPRVISLPAQETVRRQ